MSGGSPKSKIYIGIIAALAALCAFLFLTCGNSNSEVLSHLSHNVEDVPRKSSVTAGGKQQQQHHQRDDDPEIRPVSGGDAKESGNTNGDLVKHHGDLIVEGKTASFGGHSDSLASRFFDAYINFRAVAATDSYTLTVCSKLTELGGRGGKQSVPQTGALCELFVARGAINSLDKVMRRDWNVLEFSSGSSSIWFTLRSGHVVTVEHCEGWLSSVAGTIRRIKGRVDNEGVPTALTADWHGYAAYCQTCACDTPALQGRRFKASYFNISFLKQFAPYDLVSIDGRGRAFCLESVLETLGSDAPLLKQHGVLMLDNSQRKRYWSAMNRVPKQWPRFQFRYPEGERTTVWVRCDNESDSYCDAVREMTQKIQDAQDTALADENADENGTNYHFFGSIEHQAPKTE